MSIPPPHIPKLPQSGIATSNHDEGALPSSPPTPQAPARSATPRSPSRSTMSNQLRPSADPKPRFTPTAIPEHTQAIDHVYGHGVQALQQNSRPTPHSPTPRFAEQHLPKGPQRFYFPPFILAAVAIAFLGMLAWWVVEEPELAALETPAPLQPRPAAVVPPSPPPVPQLPQLAPPPRIEPEPERPAVRPRRPRTRTRNKPRNKPKAKPEPRPEASPLPPTYVRKLSDEEIRHALRPTRARVRRRCPAQPSRVSVDVRLTVRPDGTVKRVGIGPRFADSALGDCIHDLAKITIFPPKERSEPSQVRAAFHVGPQD